MGRACQARLPRDMPGLDPQKLERKKETSLNHGELGEAEMTILGSPKLGEAGRTLSWIP